MKQEYSFNEESTERTRKVFVRQKTMEKKRKDLHENPMEMPLCAICAQDFYDSPWHRIYRVDPYQVIFDTCTRCHVRRGYDYKIYDYRKPVVKKENIIVLA